MMVLLSLAIAQANGSWCRRPWIRAPPDEAAVLAVHHVCRLDVAHARRIGGSLRARVMGMAAEHDRLALSRPGALEIGDGVLRARDRCRGGEQRQCEDW